MFFKLKSETERLFAMASKENFVLRQMLDQSQRELLKTKKKLDAAKSQLSQLGIDVSQYEYETNAQLENLDSGVLENYENILAVDEKTQQQEDAILELYEMMEV